MRFLRRLCTAGPFNPFYLLNLEAKLYIGQFTSFVQAFNHWRGLAPMSEKWFIVSTKDATRIITSAGGARWYKLEEPRPLKVPIMNGAVPGRKYR